MSIIIIIVCPLKFSEGGDFRFVEVCGLSFGHDLCVVFFFSQGSYSHDHVVTELATAAKRALSRLQVFLANGYLAESPQASPRGPLLYICDLDKVSGAPSW